MDNDKKDMFVRVDVVSLLDEIQNNAIHPKDMAALKIPFGYFRTLLNEVARRSVEINDDELNRLMIRMCLYSVSQPNSADYNGELVDLILENEVSK
ncbi:hypothetical protein ACS8E2_14350 [Psychrobacter glaciei]|uniref:hypothetical protein n=1 Tax=Psychrobacter glaciei TaxID=619771 RepID=UPI003F48D5E6